MTDIEILLKKNGDRLRYRDPEANKGTYGRLLAVAGSKGMAGAAYLNCIGAFRTGMGMVKLFGPEENRIILQTLLPEAMYSVSERNDGTIDKEELVRSIAWADYISVGSGLSRSDHASAVMELLYEEDVRGQLWSKKLLILDADALNYIADSGLDPGGLCRNTVITPHVGEMSRLTGLSTEEIKRDPLACAMGFRKKHENVLVVLKDHRTAVAGEQCMMIESGCGAMAKAGSGDVLCGFIAGISGVLKGEIADAVPIAVWLHGRAGSIAAMERGCHSILAGDIADAAGKAISDIDMNLTD